MGNPNILFSDRLLPNQDTLCDQFKGTPDSYHHELLNFIFKTSGLSVPDPRFNLSYSDQFTVEQMGSDPINLKFYDLLIRLSGARHVLEIGTFIGLSTMSFAKAVPDDGTVCTIEKYSHFAGIARKNFIDNGLDSKIQLLEGDAIQLISSFPEDTSFDFIFIDGDKENYPTYFLKLEPFLSAKGIMVLDDVFFHGDAVNAQPESKKGLGVKKALEMIENHEGFHKVVLPLCNGVLLAIRA